MAAFRYPSKRKPNGLNQKDYTIISKAIKFFMRPYEDDEHGDEKEFELSAKERHLLAQLRTTLKKITEIRKANR